MVKKKAARVPVRSFEKFVERLNAVGLRNGVQELSLASHVSLRELYEGPIAPSIIAARRTVYSWLMGEGKGVNEIARLFDRAPSGIFKMTRGRAA